MRARLLVLVVVPFGLAACGRSTGARTRPASFGVADAPSAAATSAAAADAAAPRPRGGKGPDIIATSRGDLRVVPVHHGTVLFEFGGKEYWVDPFHEGNLDGRPPADFIFITHVHPDHMDPGAIEKLRKPSTILVGPPSVADKLEPHDKPGDSTGIVVMKNGDKQTFDGVGVEAVPMYNLKRGPVPNKVFHEKGVGDGYVFTFGDKRVYVSGDTECTPEMRALKSIDVAFLCMNLPYTMPPLEAAECVDAFNPKILYPYHYRGSDLGELERALLPDKRVEVRFRDWY